MFKIFLLFLLTFVFLSSACATEKIGNPINTRLEFQSSDTRNGHIVENISLEELQNKIEETVAKVAPSIIAIRVFSESYGISHGSGVIIDEEGYILTSEHLVNKAHSISVLFFNKEIYQAELVGSDIFSDLAIIKVNDATGLKKIEFGDSDKIKPGKFVLSFGNAFGYSFQDGQPTVTLGIISALDRVFTPFGAGRMYRRALQHDSAINPGSSGGPLCDLEGKMLGLNGVISSNTGNYAGVSFAVPVNIILDSIPLLKEGKEPVHPYIGIGGLENMISQPSVGAGRRGVLIKVVSKNSPAGEAGLQPGDIILEVNEKPVQGTVELLNWLSKSNVGDKIALRIIRFETLDKQGETLTFELTLGSRPK